MVITDIQGTIIVASDQVIVKILLYVEPVKAPEKEKKNTSEIIILFVDLRDELVGIK